MGDWFRKGRLSAGEGYSTVAFLRLSCPSIQLRRRKALTLLPHPIRQRRLLDDPEAEVDMSSGNISFTSYIPQATATHPTFEKHRYAVSWRRFFARMFQQGPDLVVSCLAARSAGSL